MVLGEMLLWHLAKVSEVLLLKKYFAIRLTGGGVHSFASILLQKNRKKKEVELPEGHAQTMGGLSFLRSCASLLRNTSGPEI